MTSTTNHAGTTARRFSAITFFLGLAFIAQLVAATLGIASIARMEPAPSLVITGAVALTAGAVFARFAGSAE